jgi:hypothetical protein
LAGDRSLTEGAGVTASGMRGASMRIAIRTRAPADLGRRGCRGDPMHVAEPTHACPHLRPCGCACQQKRVGSSGRGGRNPHADRCRPAREQVRPRMQAGRCVHARAAMGREWGCWPAILPPGRRKMAQGCDLHTGRRVLDVSARHPCESMDVVPLIAARHSRERGNPWTLRPVSRPLRRMQGMMEPTE